MNASEIRFAEEAIKILNQVDKTLSSAETLLDQAGLFYTGDDIGRARRTISEIVGRTQTGLEHQ